MPPITTLESYPDNTSFSDLNMPFVLWVIIIALLLYGWYGFVRYLKCAAGGAEKKYDHRKDPWYTTAPLPPQNLLSLALTQSSNVRRKNYPRFMA